MCRNVLWAELLLVSPMTANAAVPKALACKDHASAALGGSQCATVDVPLRHANRRALARVRQIRLLMCS